MTLKAVSLAEAITAFRTERFVYIYDSTGHLWGATSSGPMPAQVPDRVIRRKLKNLAFGNKNAVYYVEET